MSLVNVLCKERRRQVDNQILSYQASDACWHEFFYYRLWPEKRAISLVRPEIRLS